MFNEMRPAFAFTRGAVTDAPPRVSADDLPSGFGTGARSPRRRSVAALATVLALGATTFFIASRSGDDSSFQPAAEPAVAAEDLSLGSMFHVVDQIGARELWNQGITGAGVNVAVIDTGVAPVDGLLDEGQVVAGAVGSGGLIGAGVTVVDGGAGLALVEQSVDRGKVVAAVDFSSEGAD